MNFFKTGPGQYAEGDLFLGLTVPQTRKTIQPFLKMPLAEVQTLLRHQYHECRLGALLILVHQFQYGDTTMQKEILELYLANTHSCNNWDLVDSSASYIVGAAVPPTNIALLKKLAGSNHLWENRIAIVATHFHIRSGHSQPTLSIATLLLQHPHDLIHKATGWMLRELGKRDLSALLGFLDQHAATMPRTMLRYAIERLNKKEKELYMKMKSMNK